MHAFVAGLLLLTAAVWFLVALGPALRELVRPTDDRPLRVSSATEDVRHFADGLRAFVDREVGASLDAAPAQGSSSGSFTDGVPFLLLHGDGRVAEAQAADGRTVDRSVVASGTLSTGPGLVFAHPLYARADIRIGADTVVRAARAERDIEFGERATCLRFIHACGQLRAGVQATLYGRCSADTVMSLADDVYFERLFAPRIEFGDAAAAAPPHPVPTQPFAPHDDGEFLAGRWLCTRSVTVPAHCVVEGDMVVRGDVEIGDGASIRGSVKAHGNVQVGWDVVIDGALVAQGRITTAPGCRLAGPVVSEDTAFIGTDNVIGTTAAPTTVTAPHLLLGAGTVAFGTVWAREGGLVQSR